MAVVPVKKIYLIAHKSCRQKMIDALHGAGLLHISEVSSDIESTEAEHLAAEREEKLKNMGLLMAKVHFAIDFLERFKEEKRKGLLTSMIKEKVRIGRSRLETIEGKINFNHIYDKCESLESELSAISSRLHYLDEPEQALLPWKSLRIPLAELEGTEKTATFAGEIPVRDLAELQAELDEAMPESAVEVVSEFNRSVNFVLFYWRSEESKVTSILGGYNFTPANFLGLKGMPKEEIAKISKERKELEAERRAIVKEAQELVYLRPDLQVFHDFMVNERTKLEVQSNFAGTEKSFMIEGWLKAKDVPRVEKLVKEVSPGADLTILDPAPDEKPPVILENKGLFAPFETLTRLYGFPDYNELDPTPFLAPFFFLFFGICLGDVGYGLILILACWWMIKKLEVSENVKKGILLFAYGGVASIIVGVLTGSYFGLEEQVLPEFLKKLAIIWPLKDIETFLVLMIILGVIQVSFGIILAGVNNIRNGQVADAICDQLTTLLFLWSAVAAVSSWLGGILVKPVPLWARTISTPSLWAMSATILAVVFLQGRYVNRLFRVFSELLGFFRQKQTLNAVKNLVTLMISVLFAFSIISWILTLFVFTGLHTDSGWLILISLLLSLILKPSRQLLASFFGGVYSLYNMSGYIGDFLSYVRLLALGLATTLIAGVANLLGGMLITASYAGIQNFTFTIKGVAGLLFSLLGLVLAVVVVIGFFHLFNLVINLIGCFVHPARLQFVEFFGQFYSNGGRRFQPFGLQTRYVIFEE